MANTRISNLTASASNLASTDLAPVVQTAGVGPVKMTGLQLAGGLLGSTTFNGATSAGTALSTVAITGTGGQFSCAAATLVVGQNVTISGTLGGTGSITGYSSPTTYTISATNGSTTFTLVNASTGAALTTTAGTPTGLTYVVTSPVVNFTQTWNNSNVTFTGLKFNATDTASASGSLLLDLQVGGTSKARIDKDGVLTLNNNGTAIITPNVSGATTFQYLNNGIKFLNAVGLFFFGSNGNTIGISAAGAAVGSSVTSLDVLLRAAGTGVLQLGAADVSTGAVAQTLQVQSNTGASNGPNFTIKGSNSGAGNSGGSIIFQTATAGAYATALTIDSTKAATLGGNLVLNGSTNGSGIKNQGGSNYASLDSDGGYGFSFYDTNSATTIRVASVAGIKNLVFGSTAQLAWGSSNTATTGDLFLARDAANTLALRNSTNAQTFNVYGTYTDASNYERLSIKVDTSGVTFSNENLGSGFVRGINFSCGGVVGWSVSPSRNLLAGADNTYDIGASGANRPRNVYVAGNIASQGGSISATSGNVQISAAGAFYWNTRGVIRSPSDGVISLADTAETSFNRLQFGGTTSSYPALKRSSATLQARLADDSAFTAIQGKLTTDTARTAGDPTTDGYLVVYDSTGTAYKVPCVAV